MELRHIRYFIAVAEELHFTRAAARLSIAQPPLSQQIRQLEDELGVKLFLRSRHGVQLTDAGQIFLDRARIVTEAVDDARVAAQQAGRGEIGRLVIGFGGSMALDVLAGAVAEHRKRYPGVDVTLREMMTSAQVQGLLEGRLHVGLLREWTADERLRIEVLRREPLVVVLPSGHRLAHRAQLSLRDLAGEGFVLAPSRQSSSFSDVVLDACAKVGFSPRVVQEASETLTILGLVGAGIGISLLPASVQGIHARGVVYRSLRGQSATVELAAASRIDAASPLVKAFLETCRATITADRREDGRARLLKTS